MIHRPGGRRPRALLIALALAALAGCVTNPVTGQREISFMSPEREAALGAQAAKQVEAEIGLVDDPALARYVEQIGERLAPYSPRRDVQYRFSVADMAEPNAFALPGGFTYVSRGLLIIANSEGELANVMGHEIGHVAARHAAQRETRSIGVGILSTVGTVLAGIAGGAEAAQAVGQAGQVAGAGYIASYGRDQERQSDDVGMKMAAAAGYDPVEMASFLRTLERESTLRGGGQERRPSFLDSHPMTGERIQTAVARARALTPAPPNAVARDRADFLSRLEGLLVGPDPSEGVFRDQLFLHPDLGFALTFPPGWRTQNGKSAVAGQPPEGDAVIVLEGQGPTGDPRAAANDFAQQNGLQLQEGRALRIGGLDAYRAVALARGPQGELAVDLTWLAHRRGMFRIRAMTSPARFAELARDFERTAQSFRPLTRRERDGITELRLHVVRSRGNETLATLGHRVGNAWSLEQTAIANGLSTTERLHYGQTIKVALRRPYRPGQ